MKPASNPTKEPLTPPPWAEIAKTTQRLTFLAREIHALHAQAVVLTDNLEQWFGPRQVTRLSNGTKVNRWDTSWWEQWNEDLINDENFPAWEKNGLEFLRQAYEENRFPPTEIVTLDPELIKQGPGGKLWLRAALPAPQPTA